MKVHKGDTVLVIAGKDKGAKGKVIQATPRPTRSSSRASTASRSTPRFLRTSVAPPSGGIVTQEAPINVSNVMVVDSDGNPTRVGYRTARRPASAFAFPEEREGHLT